MSHPVEHPACRHCGTALHRPLKGYYLRRGFCGSPCERAYTPQLRTVLCANTSCKRGEGGTRNVFTTFKPHARCCCKPCHSVDWQRRCGWVTSKAKRDALPARMQEPRQVPNILDLSAEQIERRLEALARRRRETRSWLRIEDPWQQRSGSELHKQTTVETYSLEGAIL